MSALRKHVCIEDYWNENCLPTETGSEATARWLERVTAKMPLKCKQCGRRTDEIKCAACKSEFVDSVDLIKATVLKITQDLYPGVVK